MSLVSNLIPSTAEGGPDQYRSLSDDLLEAVALARDSTSGMRSVSERVRLGAGAKGVEWWGVGEDETLTRLLTSGTSRGPRDVVSMGRAGALVIHGGAVDEQLESALSFITPVVNRRINEERLARAASCLARRNEALDEFATLVAHELKTPLHAALATEHPATPIGTALDLVDELLAAARAPFPGEASTDVAESLARAIDSLQGTISVTSALAVPLPLPAGSLFVLLRNLLSNAVSAGACNVHIVTERSYGRARLFVDDDGSGPGAAGAYATGSRIGLPLCRRIVARSGGVLELAARRPTGSRASVTFEPARA